MKTDKCQNCNNYHATYEVKSGRKMLSLCDYCFHLQKWGNLEKEYIVESHLSTKESIGLYHKAIRDFLIPKIVNLINKEAAENLLRIEKEKGMNSVMAKLKRDHQDIVSCFCIKFNLSYPEFITALRLYTING